MKNLILLTLLICFFNFKSNAQSNLKTTNEISVNNFTVIEKEGRRFFEWTTNEPTKVNYWKLQQSYNKEQFSNVALILGADPEKSNNNYKFKDKEIENIKMFYRLVCVDTAGGEHFSEIFESVK